MKSREEWEGLEGFVDELRRLEAPSEGDRREVGEFAHGRSLRKDTPARMLWQAGVALAGVAALALVYVTRTPSAASSISFAAATRPLGAPDDSVSASESDARKSFASLLSPWPAYAHAQGPDKPMPAPYPPLTALDPTRLRPGRRSYVRLSANNYHASLPHETWTTELDTVWLHGELTWRMARHVDRLQIRGPSQGTDDTLWLRASDLSPRLRRVHASSFWTSGQIFTDTSILSIDSVVLSGKGKSRPPVAWMHRRVIRPGGPYVVSSDMLRLLLRAAPLNSIWRASVQVGLNNNPANPLAPAYVNLRVAGVDTVQLFNGRYPCWRVVIEATGTPERWCVSQETGETLVTDGPYDASYPESRSVLMYGLEETIRLPPVRRR